MAIIIFIQSHLVMSYNYIMRRFRLAYTLIILMASASCILGYIITAHSSYLFGLPNVAHKDYYSYHNWISGEDDGVHRSVLRNLKQRCTCELFHVLYL